MEETSNTQWELIEVVNRRGKERLPHLVAVEVRRRRLFFPEATPPRLESASIELAAYVVGDGGSSTTPIGRMGGSYQGGIDPRFTLTGGSMLIDPAWRGLYIGTFLQNKVVVWAHQDVGLAGHIVPIALSSNDALDEASRDRRNRFYEQFGITFDWSAGTGTIEHASGRSHRTLTIADVHAIDTVSGVAAQPLLKGVSQVVDRALRAEGSLSASTQGWQEQRKLHRLKLQRWQRGCVVCGAAGIVVGYCLRFL